ncbi:MAG: GerMN domain-containing protein [Bacillota bacterium]
MRRLLCIISVCILIISFFAGCSAAQKFGLGENDEACPVSSIALSEADAQKLSDKTPIHLYFANEDNTKLRLEIRYIPMSEANKSVNHLAEIIVNELIKGPKVAGLKPTVPAEAKLKSKVKIDGDVATVDFSKEFRDKHPGGRAEETMTIYSIVNSLTEIKEINNVKFLIDGKAIPEFKGNFRFNKAFPRSTSLISKKTEPAGTGNTGGSKDTGNTNNNKDKKDDVKSDPKKGDAKSEAGLTEEDEGKDAAAEIMDDQEIEETFDEEMEETFNEEFEETYIEFLE